LPRGLGALEQAQHLVALGEQQGAGPVMIHPVVLRIA